MPSSPDCGPFNRGYRPLADIGDEVKRLLAFDHGLGYASAFPSSDIVGTILFSETLTDTDATDLTRVAGEPYRADKD